MIKQHDILVESITKEMLKLSKLAEKNDKCAYKYLEEIDKALIAEEKISNFYEMGNEYRTQRKYSESIKAFKKAIKRDHFYSSFTDIAITYQWMKQFKKSLYYSNKALEIIIRYACRKVLKSRQYLNKSNRLTKEDLAKLILVIKKSIVSDTNYGITCGLMSTSYEKIGELKKAKKLQKEYDKSMKKYCKECEHLLAGKGASS